MLHDGTLSAACRPPGEGNLCAVQQRPGRKRLRRERRDHGGYRSHGLEESSRSRVLGGLRRSGMLPATFKQAEEGDMSAGGIGELLKRAVDDRVVPGVVALVGDRDGV